MHSLNTAIELDSDNAEAFFLRGMSRIISTDDLNSIVEDLMPSNSLDPENSKYSLTLAEIYSELNQLDQAQEFYHKAFKADPSIREARSWLNKIKNQTTQVDEVKSHEKSTD